ncbi:MAG TPA: hypothetical protein VG269_13325 [Tepidisphaeraceae bacterium]|jgi:hypothetical protein|nr:hypothetical protein [Tepidisphaeraceae bacterium]
MSGHQDKLAKNDTLVNAAMLRKSVGEILKRVNLDSDHDIPYLAGYSVDRSKIYIDRHVGKVFKDHLGRRHKVSRFLILHEATEKAVIDTWGLHYQHAHQIALRAEEAAVRASGIRWRDYDRYMQKWIKTADSNKLTKVPRDLDLTPYLDENDGELIKVMQKAMTR